MVALESIIMFLLPVSVIVSVICMGKAYLAMTPKKATFWLKMSIT